MVQPVAPYVSNSSPSNHLWQHLPDAETGDDTRQVVGEFSVPDGWTVE